MHAGTLVELRYLVATRQHLCGVEDATLTGYLEALLDACEAGDDVDPDSLVRVLTKDRDVERNRAKALLEEAVDERRAVQQKLDTATTTVDGLLREVDRLRRKAGEEPVLVRPSRRRGKKDA